MGLDQVINQAAGSTVTAFVIVTSNASRPFRTSSLRGRHVTAETPLVVGGLDGGCGGGTSEGRLFPRLLLQGLNACLEGLFSGMGARRIPHLL